MKLEADPQLVEEVRRRYESGERLSAILIDLSTLGVIGFHQHVLIEAAFGLTHEDTRCLTLWLPTSGAEADAKLDEKLSKAIERQRPATARHDIA